MFLLSSCCCLCHIFWSHVLSWEWRCSWSSADRLCSNYIWVINNLIAYKGALILEILRYVITRCYMWYTSSKLFSMCSAYYDLIKWKHFLRYWPFVRGIHRSPVNSAHKGQWRRALMFSLICPRINGWVNNVVAGDLRCRRAYSDITVISIVLSLLQILTSVWVALAFTVTAQTCWMVTDVFVR